MLILATKCVSFNKTLLLIMVSGIVIDDWNQINKGMPMEKKKQKNIILVL